MEKLEEIFLFLGLLKAEALKNLLRLVSCIAILLPLRHLTTSIGVAVLAVEWKGNSLNASLEML